MKKEEVKLEKATRQAMQLQVETCKMYIKDEYMCIINGLSMVFLTIKDHSLPVGFFLKYGIAWKGSDRN